MVLYIYVLRLENNKYYVGKTTKQEFRVDQHFNGDGSTWTKKYKPIKIIEMTEGDEWDEDKYVKIYMKKYGIYNVRGGSYASAWLDPSVIALLQKEIDGASDNCFRCGRSSHWIKDCYAKTHINGKKLDNNSNSNDSNKNEWVIVDYAKNKNNYCVVS